MKERISHYRIACELGRGGMGVVYRAHEESLGRDVAIKVLGEHLAEDPAAVERFTREARSAAGLNHPNIVQIYATGSDDGHPYFVMEYVDGTSLQRLLEEQGPMDWIAAAGIVVQAASGLGAAHERGIIHRDIKPANLLIDRRGLVKIADFGLALAIAGATRLTAAGMMMGTPGYLSPEQCRDLDIDHRTDIYSLGATFYEMLTSSPPFSADSPLGLIKKIVEAEPPDVCALNPAVDPAVSAVLQRMMAKDREQRYATCAEVIADLEAALGSRAQPAPGSGRVAPVSAPPGAAAAPGGLDTAPTVGSGGGLPPLPVTTPLPSSPTAPPAPEAVPVAPPPQRSRALPLLLVLAAVLLLTAALGLGAVFAWRRGLVAQAVARFTGGRPSAAASISGPPLPAAALPTPAAATETSAVAPLSEDHAHEAAPSPAPRPTSPPPPAPVGAAESAPAGRGEAGGGTSPAPARSARLSTRSGPAERPPLTEPTAVVAASGVMVLAVGEPLLAGEARQYLESALRRGGAEVVDASAAPEVEELLGAAELAPRAELRDAVARHARRLLLVRATYLGERPLEYMGRIDTAYQARLTVAAMDLAARRPAGPPFDDTLEYTHLTVERVVATRLRPWLRGLASSLTGR